jgi:hypothetical protein
LVFLSKIMNVWQSTFHKFSAFKICRSHEFKLKFPAKHVCNRTQNISRPPSTQNSFVLPTAHMATVDISHIKINKVPSETELHDVMKGASRWDVSIHEHGRFVGVGWIDVFVLMFPSVSLVDVMPRLAPIGQTADFAIVQVLILCHNAIRLVINITTDLQLRCNLLYANFIAHNRQHA